MVQMGHTNLRTLYAHYRARVSPADATAYWAIVPRTGTEKVVAFTAA